MIEVNTVGLKVDTNLTFNEQKIFEKIKYYKDVLTSDTYKLSDNRIILRLQLDEIRVLSDKLNGWINNLIGDLDTYDKKINSQFSP